MRQFFISLLAAAGLMAFSGIAQAECFGSHTTTASVDSGTVATDTSTPIVPAPSDG